MITKIYEKLKNFIKENYKGLITLLIVFLVFTIELPYSIYTPGGAVNLNDRIKVEGANKVTGSFNMAYVSMVKGSLPFLLISKVIPDWDIVKKDDITIEGENINEMIERERLYLEESIANATINAYHKAGEKIVVTETNNLVSYISKDADTNLKIGDDILSVNGVEIDSLEELQSVIEALEGNVQVKLEIERDNKKREATAKTYELEGEIKIGISILNTYDYDVDPNLKIESKASEMGSSGGLMMSLTIYNQLVPEDITKGKKIVGTGTIDIEGNVGKIGGVKYKLIGAVKNDADVFICPEENLEEVMNVVEGKDYDIKIISAKTFEEVLEKLEDI